MQKWLPDAFQPEAGAAATVVHQDDGFFETDLKEAPQHSDENQRLFMSESGFAGPEAIMSHLTREERAQVFELVEQDITREYEVRETELRKKMQEDLDLAKGDFEETLASWTEELTQTLSAHLKETTDATARLTVKIAEKIIRKQTDIDTGVLLRALETTLFKLDGTKQVVISVNPKEAEWLESQPQVLKKLGITQVVADRRVAKGGCLVRTEKQEWDATIKGQLDFLTEMVEEMITTSDQPDLTGEGQPDADNPVE